MEKETKKLKVAVGLSGGVDSSVSAYLLQSLGYDVTGVHLTCWDTKGDGCTAEADRDDAAQVAAKLGIRFVALNFVNEYKNTVISNFYSEYKAGRTPNPDVLCNREIKFGLFLDWAEKNGFDKIATGHYARCIEDANNFKILMGVDNSKDQTYFLYRLTPEKLKKVLFPVGHLNKSEVRHIATELGLHTASKPDSMGICFVGNIDIHDFLKKEIPIKLGYAVNTKGEVIGDHDGVSFYTVGQRHGFRVTKYVGVPLYVVGKKPESNTLILGNFDEAKVNSFKVNDLNWIFKPVTDSFKCHVRIRHLGELFECQAKFIHEGELDVVTTDQIFGVAPGQSAVFYLGEEMLGGGVITETQKV